MKPFLLLLALSPSLLFAGQKNGKPSDQDPREQHLKPEGEPFVYKTVEGQPRHLWVIKPSDWKAADHRPAIVWFHGGGWEISKGAPTQFNYQGRYLATRGAVSIQVEYQLIADNRKEAPLGACRDAKSAMRWVRSHAAELGIDPNRIASGGGSAGGHLAAFVGMVEGTEDPQDDLKVSCRPNAMLLYNPALLGEDKFAKASPESAKPPVSAELGQVYATISPFLNVTPDDPSGIIMVGSEDGILPPAQRDAFKAKCDAAKLRMDIVVYPGEGHSFFGISRSLDRFYDTTLEVDKFLISLGWLTGSPTLTRELVNQYAAEIPAGLMERGQKKKAPTPVPQ